MGWCFIHICAPVSVQHSVRHTVSRKQTSQDIWYCQLQSFLLNLKCGVSVLPVVSSVAVGIILPTYEGFLKINHDNVCKLSGTQWVLNANYKLLLKERKSVDYGDTCLLIFFCPLFSVAFVGLWLWNRNRSKRLWNAVPPPCLYNPVLFTWLRRGSPLPPTSSCPM